jgi:predicted RNase H-like nuclease (RuvC/YqgF family)
VRFKEDIHPIPDALEKVLRLNGVYFKWNRLHRETLKRSNGLTSRQVGLIAQQVREVVPELVSEWADEGAEDYLAVDYSRLSALTIEAIKELAEQNQNLAEENKALREELAEQDRKLKAKEESIQERLTTENKAIREEIRTLQQAVKRLAAS